MPDDPFPLALVVKPEQQGPIEIGVDAIEVVFRVTAGSIHIRLEDDGLYVNVPANDVHIIPSAANAFRIERAP